jgi:hypothetical protein
MGFDLTKKKGWEALKRFFRRYALSFDTALRRNSFDASPVGRALPALFRRVL